MWHFTDGDHSWQRISYDTRSGPSFRTYTAAQVKIVSDAQNAPRAASVIAYWRQIVASRPDDDPIVESYKTMDFVRPDSALAGYLDGRSAGPTPASTVILVPPNGSHPG